ncbi:MAG: transporter ATP-binding protein/permease, partial [Hyphomicrobiales bacterium]|nr:transporter ATP-binding protein/permease [Hyphomicrobiales bacterium]
MARMSGNDTSAGLTRRPPNLLFRFIRLALRFWSGKTKRIGSILAAGFLGALIANVLMAVAVNRWSKYFFDAVQDKNIAAIQWSIALVIGLAVASAFASIGLTQARMRLQLRWREWVTDTLISKWLGERRFYQLNILKSVDNPEARIAEDGRLSIELLVDLAGGILNTFMVSLAFIVVLWQVGGSYTVAGFTIPGYLVFAVVIYTGLTSFIMYRLGRPLVERVEAKAAGEGDFRYALTRTRENAETIALIGGEEDEHLMLKTSFSELAMRWIAVIGQQTKMIFLSNGNNVLAPAVPLLLGAPKYLAGEMTLGDLMQATAAFSQVQTALNWLADNALNLANWSASARRVAALDKAYDDLDRMTDKRLGKAIVIDESDDGAIHLISVSVSDTEGTIMLSDADALIQKGEKVLVKGESGSGKSTLIRAVAGLWPWGSGRILLPQGASFSFMPQRPYIPLGTLRGALAYPDDGHVIEDKAIAEVLEECGLEHLLPKIDEEDNWSSILSGGEQQRLAFARIFLKHPDIVIMDEATSALDELSQKRMMELMGQWLPDAMVIHVAHRPGLDKYPTREILLVREKGEPATVQDSQPTKVRIAEQLLQRLMLGRKGKSKEEVVAEIVDAVVPAAETSDGVKIETKIDLDTIKDAERKDAAKPESKPDVAN